MNTNQIYMISHKISLWWKSKPKKQICVPIPNVCDRNSRSSRELLPIRDAVDSMHRMRRWSFYLFQPSWWCARVLYQLVGTCLKCGENPFRINRQRSAYQRGPRTCFLILSFTQRAHTGHQFVSVTYLCLLSGREVFFRGKSAGFAKLVRKRTSTSSVATRVL